MKSSTKSGCRMSRELGAIHFATATLKGVKANMAGYINEGDSAALSAFKCEEFQPVTANKYSQCLEIGAYIFSQRTDFAPHYFSFRK